MLVQSTSRLHHGASCRSAGDHHQGGPGIYSWQVWQRRGALPPRSQCALSSLSRCIVSLSHFAGRRDRDPDRGGRLSMGGRSLTVRVRASSARAATVFDQARRSVPCEVRSGRVHPRVRSVDFRPIDLLDCAWQGRFGARRDGDPGRDALAAMAGVVHGGPLGRLQLGAAASLPFSTNCVEAFHSKFTGISGIRA